MARTKADKRRGRAARGINREMDKRWRRHPREPRDDPAADTLARRARQSGVATADAAHPWHGDIAGRVIARHAVSIEETARLWGVFAQIDGAWTIYCARILGRSPHPAVMRAELRRERMEASASDPLDLRPPEERDRAAIAAWDAWRRRLRRLPTAGHVAVKLALARDEALLCGRRCVDLAGALRALGR